MEKTDAFFVFLIILAVIIAPLNYTGYAVMAGQGQTISNVTFDGMSLIKDSEMGTFLESPQGNTYPMQIQYGTPSNFSFDLTIENKGETLSDVEIRLYEVYGTGYENGDISMSHATTPEHVIQAGSIRPGQLMSFDIPASARSDTATNVLGEANPIEKLLNGISNVFIDIGNGVGGLFGLPPSPKLNVDTVTEGQISFFNAVLYDKTQGEVVDRMGVMLVSGIQGSDVDPLNTGFGFDEYGAGEQSVSSGFGFDEYGAGEQSVSSGFGFDDYGTGQQAV